MPGSNALALSTVLFCSAGRTGAACNRTHGCAWDGRVIVNSKNEVSDNVGTTHLSRLPELAISISQFDLRQEIRLLRKEESWRRGVGRSSRTLVKQQDFRIVLVLMKGKTSLTEHRANARISIQTISGRIRVRIRNQNMVELPVAGLLALDSSIPYDVEAIRESAILLTISWPRQYATWDSKSLSENDG